MCIIVYKPADEEMPTDEILKNCFVNNPDGSGFMYRYNRMVHIKKGFMTFDDFKSAIASIPNPKVRDVVMHFRIATHGTVCPENCHPFPITNSVVGLRNTSACVSHAIAHNGVISGFDMTKNVHNLSDTMMFVKQIEHSVKDFDVLKGILRATYGKFILLSPKKTVISGEWIFDDGIMYSNNSYEAKTYYSYCGNVKVKPKRYEDLLNCDINEVALDDIERWERESAYKSFQQLGEWWD